MEANYFRWVKKSKPHIDISYEPEKFIFPNNITGIKSYVPDFKLRLGKSVWYVECKGFMDDLSKDKFNLMRIYYPYIKIYLVGQRSYGLIKKMYSQSIPYWEN